MIIEIIGVGVLGVFTVGALARGAGRRSLPIDVAGTVRAALRTQNSQIIESAVKAIEPKYPSQAKTIRGAIVIASDPHLMADIRATYLTTLMSGQPESLKTEADAFEAKYHYLASRLRDMAEVLATLKGVA
jgi:hypothetical protein